MSVRSVACFIKCAERVLAAETRFKELDKAEQPDFLLPTDKLKEKLVEQRDEKSLKALEMDVDAELRRALLEPPTADETPVKQLEERSSRQS